MENLSVLIRRGGGHHDSDINGADGLRLYEEVTKEEFAESTLLFFILNEISY